MLTFWFWFKPWALVLASCSICSFHSAGITVSKLFHMPELRICSPLIFQKAQKESFLEVRTGKQLHISSYWIEKYNQMIHGSVEIEWLMNHIIACYYTLWPHTLIFRKYNSKCHDIKRWWTNQSKLISEVISYHLFLGGWQQIHHIPEWLRC